MAADLQARTGQYSEKVAVVSLAAGLATLGLWAAGIIKGVKTFPVTLIRMALGSALSNAVLVASWACETCQGRLFC